MKWFWSISPNRRLQNANNNQQQPVDEFLWFRVKIMFCFRMVYFEGHFMLVCGSNWCAKDWYFDRIRSIWKHQTITTTVSTQPTRLYGQRMGSEHEMKEFRSQVGWEKNVFVCVLNCLRWCFYTGASMHLYAWTPCPCIANVMRIMKKCWSCLTDHKPWSYHHLTSLLISRFVLSPFFVGRIS